MKIVKMAFIALVLFCWYKHRNETHWPIWGFAFDAPDSLQEQQAHIELLEQEISRRNQSIALVYDMMTKVRPEGTVLGRTPCGAVMRITDSGITQLSAEASRLQIELDQFNRDLREAKMKLADTRQPRP